jgi:hypothetical protein
LPQDLLGQRAITPEFIENRSSNAWVCERLERDTSVWVELARRLDQTEDPRRFQVFHVNVGGKLKRDFPENMSHVL